MAGVSVLVISCPCSLGIATPLALAAATRDAADNRMLVLNESVLERVDDSEIVVLTGDDERMTGLFEDHPAVEQVFAGVRPESKGAIVRGLCERGTTTMVGDGTNDAPALASADLGIAVASGTEIAIEAADAAVMDDRLEAVPELFELASATRGRIKQNLVWTGAYNAVAIPLAIAGIITPLLAAAMMAVSSLIVVYNSKRRLIRSEDQQTKASERPQVQARTQPN